MARLITTHDQFEAKVLAARLGSEGIVWELRGAIDSPYPMGPTHVYVESSRLDDARALTEIDSGEGADPSPIDRRRPRLVWPIALALLAGLVWALAHAVLIG